MESPARKGMPTIFLLKKALNDLGCILPKLSLPHLPKIKLSVCSQQKATVCCRYLKIAW